MADLWDKYIVQDNSKQDDWEQYATTPSPNVSGVNNTQFKPSDLLGGAIGLGAGAGAGALLLKSRIPQNIASGVGKLATGMGNLKKVTNYQEGSRFASNIREAFIQAHTDKVNEFAGTLEELAAKNPTQKVSLKNIADELRGNIDELSNETKSVLRKTPYLKNIIKAKNPSSSEISLKQSQEIINYLNTKVPKNIRANNLDLIDTINNIKGSQLEAFPEMEGARASYKQFIEPYNQVKQYFKFNRLLDAIKNKFGGAEGQAAIEKVLPKEVIKKMGGYRSAAKIAEIPQDIPLIGRAVKSIGGALSIAPQILNMFEAKKRYPNNPNAQLYMMATGQDPREEFEKWRESQII